jgi:hypothetical protein
MAFFTSRERAELGKSAEVRMKGKAREMVRHDFTPPRRRPADNELAGHVGTLMQRVAETSLQEIDDLIHELKRRREKLLNESARVQREILEYAKLSQSTMQSTKIITDSLAHFNNKAPEAHRMAEPPVEDIVTTEEHVDAAPPTQHVEDDRTFGDQIEASEGPSRPTEETT